MQKESKNSKDSEQVLKTVKNIERLLTEIKQDKIDRLNICNIVIETMKFVETFPDLSGNDKKHVVLEAIKISMSASGSFSEDSPENDILLLLPSLIDSVIDIDKGKVSIHVTEKEAVACCSALFSKKTKN